jgi:hypothetical protein
MPWLVSRRFQYNGALIPLLHFSSAGKKDLRRDEKRAGGKTMEKMIAYCGLTCSECPAYIATKKNDYESKVKLAQRWSKEYEHPFKPEDINCDGCLSREGAHIGYCGICEVRKCGMDRAVVNCAYCTDYGCEKLTKFHEMAPNAKAGLEEVRKGFN